MESKRRDFMVKSAMGLGALTLLGKSNTAEASGRKEKNKWKAENARRIALCREHMRVEGAMMLEETMGTLQDEPEYVINGGDIKGHDNILNTYKGFLGNFENLVFVERPGCLYVAENAIIFEVNFTANVKGNIAKKINVPMMVAFVFDKIGGKIVGEHAYFDNSMFAQQMA